MSMKDSIRDRIRNFLEIKEPQGLSVNIEQMFDVEGEIFKNKLWYRGNANELEKFYNHIDAGYAGNRHFWSSRPTKSMNIRKIHTGLPSLMVEKLTDVCIDDLYDIKLDKRQEEWNEIAKENNFSKLLETAVSQVFALGDGAFKFSYDKEVSNLPIIEFFPADRVDFEYSRGRLTAVVFKTKHKIRDRDYTLKEHYEKKEIYYTLENKDGKEVEMSDFSELAECVAVKNDAEFIPAVPVIFRSSNQFEGRGMSIFHNKIDAYDSLDEIWSQWMLAVRKGQIKTFVPEQYLPRDTKTGEALGYNDFDHDFISYSPGMSENDNSKITTSQGQIQSEALLAAYMTALDLCLQGIISPSTLGIDVKKLDNADSQREKEKTTLYTRDKTLESLTPIIENVVITSLKFKDSINCQKNDTDIDVTICFGGYANPSFEAQVETVGKAASTGIMSIEARVEELYGNDKDDEWKQEEVRRLKTEQGIAEMEEPAVNNELDYWGSDDE